MNESWIVIFPRRKNNLRFYFCALYPQGTKNNRDVNMHTSVHLHAKMGTANKGKGTGAEHQNPCGYPLDYWSARMCQTREERNLKK